MTAPAPGGPVGRVLENLAQLATASGDARQRRRSGTRRKGWSPRMRPLDPILNSSLNSTCDLEAGPGLDRAGRPAPGRRHPHRQLDRPSAGGRDAPHRPALARSLLLAGGCRSSSFSPRGDDVRTRSSGATGGKGPQTTGVAPPPASPSESLPLGSRSVFPEPQRLLMTPILTRPENIDSREWR